MPPPASQSAQEIEALLTLISSSVDVVKSYYAQQGQDIPSIDSVSTHPLDKVTPTLDVKRAVQTLEGACAQLTATVAPPAHTIVNRGMGHFEVACLRVVAETKVSDFLTEAGEKGLHVSEISKKTGVEEGKMGRVLRYLATKHIYREVKADVFVNNRLSILLQSDNELSSLLSHFADECFKGSSGLYEALTDPDYGPSNEPDMAPVTKVYDFPPKKTLFVWYHENPKYAKRFDRGMAGWRKATEASKLSEVYPWGNLPPSSTMTDVGGGIGHISMDLARAYPHMNFVVQDLPGTIEQGQQFWTKEYPEAIKNQRVQLKAFDFLKESPVEGCKVYYCGHIIHDWPDKESVQILTNIRKVMKPGSKVLLQEYILQHVNRVSEAEALYHQAPEPLLPNYGVGRIRQYNLDMNMMGMLNSKERTLEDFVKLGKDSGLKFSKLYDTGETGIVEFELA